MSGFLCTRSGRPTRSGTVLDTGDLRGGHGFMWLMRRNASKIFEYVCRATSPDFRGGMDTICVVDMCSPQLHLRASPPSSTEHLDLREGHIAGSVYTCPRALRVHVDRIAPREACAGVCGETQQHPGVTRLKLEFWGPIFMPSTISCVFRLRGSRVVTQF